MHSKTYFSKCKYYQLKVIKVIEVPNTLLKMELKQDGAFFKVCKPPKKFSGVYRTGLIDTVPVVFLQLLTEKIFK